MKVYPGFLYTGDEDDTDWIAVGLYSEYRPKFSDHLIIDALYYCDDHTFFISFSYQKHDRQVILE